jgi:Zn-dependent M16 (insulinase) family peptidase
LVEIKNRLISSFRGAELGEYQKSEAQYDELFETTVKEILNDCAHNHQGQDTIEMAPEQFEINKNEFHKQASGIYVPVSAAI